MAVSYKLHPKNQQGSSSHALLIWWDPKCENADLPQCWKWSHDHTVDGSALGKSQTAHNRDWSSNMYPIRCVPLLSWRAQKGLHIIFQCKHTYTASQNYLSLTPLETQPAALTVPGVFPAERMCVCVRLHSSLQGHAWAWVTENIHRSRSVELGSKRAPCLFMYIIAQVLSRMLTCQQAPFQLTSPHMIENMTCSWQAEKKVSLRKNSIKVTSHCRC